MCFTPWHLVTHGDRTACGRKVSSRMRTTGPDEWSMHEDTRCQRCVWHVEWHVEWHAKNGAK